MPIFRAITAEIRVDSRAQSAMTIFARIVHLISSTSASKKKMQICAVAHASNGAQRVMHRTVESVHQNACVARRYFASGVLNTMNLVVT